mmetsp:Transcript_26344/g.102826  ORF Transcript_26344/g.102826 Transcript_26344/m.102826 type:complete len:83 (+) Transcript_26344:93-341(+)
MAQQHDAKASETKAEECPWNKICTNGSSGSMGCQWRTTVDFPCFFSLVSCLVVFYIAPPSKVVPKKPELRTKPRPDGRNCTR